MDTLTHLLCVMLVNRYVIYIFLYALGITTILSNHMLYQIVKNKMSIDTDIPSKIVKHFIYSIFSILSHFKFLTRIEQMKLALLIVLYRLSSIRQLTSDM